MPTRTFRCLAILCLLASVAVPAAHAQFGKPPNAGQQLKFGVEMARRGLWSEALFRFRQADRLDPGNPRILNNLAVAYEATGQFEEALELYRSALERHPGDRELRRNFTRFIEFYQSYKPEGEGGNDGDGEGAGAEDGAEDAENPEDGEGA